MSRLTKRISVENEDVIFYTKGEYYNTTAGEMKSSDVREVMRKLAEYEDLEEKGLFLKLPCKVGATVWYITPDDSIALAKKTIYEAKVIRFYFMENKEGMAIDVYAEQRNTEFPLLSDIGKTVFLTKEEAEQELKRLECAE